MLRAEVAAAFTESDCETLIIGFFLAHFQSFSHHFWAIEGKILIPLISMMAWVPGIASWDTLGTSYGSLGHVGLEYIWPGMVKIRGKWSNNHGLS